MIVGRPLLPTPFAPTPDHRIGGPSGIEFPQGVHPLPAGDEWRCLRTIDEPTPQALVSQVIWVPLPSSVRSVGANSVGSNSPAKAGVPLPATTG